MQLWFLYDALAFGVKSSAKVHIQGEFCHSVLRLGVLIGRVCHSGRPQRDESQAKWAYLHDSQRCITIFLGLPEPTIVRTRTSASLTTVRNEAKWASSPGLHCFLGTTSLSLPGQDNRKRLAAGLYISRRTERVRPASLLRGYASRWGLPNEERDSCGYPSVTRRGEWIDPISLFLNLTEESACNRIIRKVNRFLQQRKSSIIIIFIFRKNFQILNNRKHIFFY